MIAVTVTHVLGNTELSAQRWSECRTFLGCSARLKPCLLSPFFEHDRCEMCARNTVACVTCKPVLPQRGETLFPLMRLLLPQLDRHRNVYGLKEKSLAT